MIERNWGIIVGIMTGAITLLVALLAGVSEETAFLRALIGSAVGAFIGMGFNYLGAAAAPVTKAKGTRLDVTLAELAPEIVASRPSRVEEPQEFHPLDIVRMAKVVQDEASKEGP